MSAKISEAIPGTTLHSIRFPGEGTEYRTARNALLRAEKDLRERLEEVAT